MTPTTLSRYAGVLGGMAWLGGAVLDAAEGPEALVNALHWGGLALVALALLGIGAGLVSSSFLALRVVVALCLTLLAWSVLEVLRDQYADRWVDGLFGLLLAAYCVAGLLTRRGEPDRPPRAKGRHSGSHAA